MVGMTRESINKQLRVWAARNWVRLEHGAIVVLKAEPLQALVEAGSGDRRLSGRIASDLLDRTWTPPAPTLLHEWLSAPARCVKHIHMCRPGACGASHWPCNIRTMEASMHGSRPKTQRKSRAKHLRKLGSCELLPYPYFS